MNVINEQSKPSFIIHRIQYQQVFLSYIPIRILNCKKRFSFTLDMKHTWPNLSNFSHAFRLRNVSFAKISKSCFHNWFLSISSILTSSSNFNEVVYDDQKWYVKVLYYRFHLSCIKLDMYKNLIQLASRWFQCIYIYMFKLKKINQYSNK